MKTSIFTKARQENYSKRPSTTFKNGLLYRIPCSALPSVSTTRYGPRSQKPKKTSQDLTVSDATSRIPTQPAAVGSSARWLDGGHPGQRWLYRVWQLRGPAVVRHACAVLGSNAPVLRQGERRGTRSLRRGAGAHRRTLRARASYPRPRPARPGKVRLSHRAQSASCDDVLALV